ncbi:hypothetical protein K437DRAFT_190147 [Tilletiaria anomala UBC 951]|uniref:Uncharacterized protein n=1 Tax=Tilletiaria anomala (strain ATCC 24038 / CBS 436.72 / UBC 951) TaxID=1037660 RepID=A0A066VJ98_TILAU|nr:uncharacterized protein K437DRAFT_190147 [Tilletiaria anomala UBC 951]KDN40348.1 hypothetical protein K437DRAFT_190147 [Tilletiaria anomala UBC 951]
MIDDDERSGRARLDDVRYQVSQHRASAIKPLILPAVLSAFTVIIDSDGKVADALDALLVRDERSAPSAWKRHCVLRSTPSAVPPSMSGTKRRSRSFSMCFAAKLVSLDFKAFMAICVYVVFRLPRLLVGARSTRCTRKCQKLVLPFPGLSNCFLQRYQPRDGREIWKGVPHQTQHPYVALDEPSRNGRQSYIPVFAVVVRDGDCTFRVLLLQARSTHGRLKPNMLLYANLQSGGQPTTKFECWQAWENSPRFSHFSAPPRMLKCGYCPMRST